MNLLKHACIPDRNWNWEMLVFKVKCLLPFSGFFFCRAVSERNRCSLTVLFCD